MALISSRTLQGNRCPLCGAAGSSCGAHEGTSPVDLLEEEAMPEGPPDVIARRVINGHKTQVITHRETAEANGWEIVGGNPHHKKIEAPTAPEPASAPVPDPEEEEEQSYDDLYSIAQDLEIRGRSKMDKDQLAVAIAEAQESEKVG